ncbi:hypothetical protein PSTG_08120 [Puccinia striiformis f. sp. tritici PST-78]|uniref:HAT C-terminal dimerisation domain-containing protein n=1 Tax=Puccinia striiformis f. sp. tritici PST-78 TaxID=1165861 RepID=A0A0L0VH03_9BASI|nr:hypothetical protein PSTG_08120 [Puccinia striiformis f. sp. tritici PST-78]
MSRNLYNHLRVILALCHMNLPHWDTLRRMRSRIRSMLKMDPSENQSVLSNKTFALNLQSIVGNELANPTVVRHLEFYPHDPRGKDMFALYQSKKWREELGPNSRVQMVPSEGKHFYIYEPVGLKDPQAPIVVPIFFYKYQDTLFLKCIKPKAGLRANAPAGSRQFDLHLPSIIPWFHSDLIEIPVDQFQKTYSELTTYYGDSYVELSCGSGLQRVDIPIPNPWRVRTGGKIIRHVPVTLYADNTSGNKSKRWNKHVTYCLTLSGLPPQLTNMEYNCHFISTSNQAGPLEIGEPIIAEIKFKGEACAFGQSPSKLGQDSAPPKQIKPATKLSIIKADMFGQGPVAKDLDDDIQQYLLEPNTKQKCDFWSQQKKIYLSLAAMATCFLGIPATSTPSEQVFLLSKTIISPSPTASTAH